MNTDTGRPTILVTNDDGIESPGIRTLWTALREVGDVVVFAPDHNWSAAGHAKTLHKPLRAERVDVDADVEAWVSTGAPSDCVALAVLGVGGHDIDMVVSGVNMGPNLGQDITYSGTVAAAFEAAISDIPAIAVSLDAKKDQMTVENFRRGAHIATQLARQVCDNGLPSHSLLNVNVPPIEPTGVKVTTLGLRFYRDELVTREDPRGRPYYWIGGARPAGDTKRTGTDIWAVANGYVSITPVHLDMTNTDMLATLRDWGVENLV